jgi:hypothetical protein
VSNAACGDKKRDDECAEIDASGEVLYRCGLWSAGWIFKEIELKEIVPQRLNSWMQHHHKNKNLCSAQSGKVLFVLFDGKMRVFPTDAWLVHLKMAMVNTQQQKVF